MSFGKIIAIASILLILFVLAYLLVVFNVSGPPAPTEIRLLGSRYLYYMLNDNETYLQAASPEAVSAILWDYRGLDTLYETMVLFTAIIGAVMIYHEFLSGKKPVKTTESMGLSLIVKAVSKIILWITMLLSIAIGLTGQLTPGGGFIGGAAFAVIPILAVLVYHPGILESIGLTRIRALLMRTTGLLLLLAVILLPLVFNGYIFQNQVKPGSEFSYPSRFIDLTPLGGSILWLNAFELTAIAGAFTLSFIILAYIVYIKYMGE